MTRSIFLSAVVLGAVAVPAFAQPPRDVRSIDGSGNNRSRDEWGKAGTIMPRKAPAAYPGGLGGAMLGEPDRPNPRYISNHMCVQSGEQPNGNRMSDMVWQWGQFIDHDITLTPAGADGGGLPGGVANIGPAANETSGMVMIPFTRSNYAEGTGEVVNGRPVPRGQINDITAWIDASMVYGSDEDTARELREGYDGLMRTSNYNLLPTHSVKNSQGQEVEDWYAGDIRAGEQVGLTAMHTLFVREHNRLARLIKERNRGWTDEQIYQLARKIVGAEIQIITYEEFLPAMLGWHAPNRLGGWNYDQRLDPSITTEFATALYRVGHTMLASNLALVDEYGHTDYLPLRDAFFNTSHFKNDPHLIDDVLRGLAAQSAQEIDARIVEDVRSFLFGMGGIGMDLAALNLQRGRDHGIPDYNTIRDYYGLQRIKSFADISEDPQIQADLAEMFGNVDNIDLWVGAICEDHLGGNCSVGSLLATAIRDQFERLRTGDRFFWKRDQDLKTATVRRIIDLNRVRLSDIIKWNTDIRDINYDVFHVY